jgi:outer membrane protein assembly factor BamB
MTRIASFALLALAFVRPAGTARGDDWPQWMGPNRDGVWAETGVLERFPKDGPKLLWSVPSGCGYSGPAVCGGKVYHFDRALAKGAKNPDDPFDVKMKVPGTERVLCLDARTGKELWKHEYPCAYQVSYAAGPRCTPTVSAGKVYALGAMGDLHCLDAATGKVLWHKHLPTEYRATVPQWGYCGHPLVHRNLVVVTAGGDAVAVALDADTGAEKWKALRARDLGYSPPTLIRTAGGDQLALWHGQALNGLDPVTGKELWKVPLEPLYAMSIMAPRQHGDRLFAAGIGGAGAVLRLRADKPEVEVVWHEVAEKNGDRKPKPRGLYPVNMTPLIEGGVIYGVDQPGMLRAVELDTGKKLWFTHKPVVGYEEDEDYKGAGSGTAFLVKNGPRWFLFAETGELVIAELSPRGYKELSRAKLLDPTGTAFGRKVVWSHPAFAEKCVFARNDTELRCYSLAAE